MRPRISIICPTWNVEKYIEETIESVLAQTYKDWEFLVMDGASTDGTVDIVKKYAARDPRIILHSEPDEGPWDATDKGVDLAKGEFISRLDGQDGYLDKDCLKKCIEVLDSDGDVSLVWGLSRGMSEGGKLLGEIHVTTSHLIRNEGFFRGIFYVLRKFASLVSEFIFGSLARKKLLLKKMCSRTALLRFNFLTLRSFPGGKAPQKEEWFRYWLDTGTVFTDQGACVAKRIYLECAQRYPKGSRMVNHLTDFNFNFNSRGYLARYIPTFSVFGRLHPGASGERVADELYRESEKYLQKVLDLRKRILGNHEEVVFRDRDGKPIFTKKFNMKASPRPALLKVSDFEEMFGEKASENLAKKIKEYNLGYWPLSEQEEEGCIEKIHKILNDPQIEQSGMHGLGRWEQGWGENLAMFQRTHDPSALIPKYFGKHEIIRWRRHFVRPMSNDFEYKVSDIITTWLFERYFANVEAIYDFGCGTGYNLLRARKVNPLAKLTGLDWTTASQEILRELILLGYIENLKASRFDLFNPDYRILLEPNSGVYTVGALEQVGYQYHKFLHYLLANQPRVCLHIEPIVELLDDNNYLDQLCKKYSEKRNYLSGFLRALRSLEKDGKLRIHRTQRTYLGGFLNESYSIIVWSLANNE